MITQKKINHEWMPEHKIKAFFKEFPEVAEYAKEEDVRAYFVSRMEEELLSYSPEEIVWGETYYSEEMWLLDENYKIVSAARKYRRKKWFCFGSIVKKTKFVEGYFDHKKNLGEMLNLLGKEVARVKIILSFFPRYGTVILYKLPKNKSVPDFFKDIRDRKKASIEEARQELLKFKAE